MDISFDIKNTEGDQVLVALSYYDTELLSVVTSDPDVLNLVFFDVTLVRKSGREYVGGKMLFAISKVLADFMDENPDAVLCYYCSDIDVRRNHNSLAPQEYRSRLFAKMFDRYVVAHNIDNLVNHVVEIVDSEDPESSQFAQFICRREHEEAVAQLGETLMHK